MKLKCLVACAAVAGCGLACANDIDLNDITRRAKKEAEAKFHCVISRSDVGCGAWRVGEGKSLIMSHGMTPWAQKYDAKGALVAVGPATDMPELVWMKGRCLDLYAKYKGVSVRSVAASLFTPWGTPSMGVAVSQPDELHGSKSKPSISSPLQDAGVKREKYESEQEKRNEL